MGTDPLPLPLSDCRAASLRTFQWALSMDGKVPPEQGLEHPELPDGTAEFLDSWLVLLERLVSPKHLLETPHTLPKLTTDGTFAEPFDPHKFMASIHKVGRTGRVRCAVWVKMCRLLFVCKFVI